MTLFVGLMSGTSLDGVDAVLADFDPVSQRPQELRGHVHAALPEPLMQELLALNTSGADELHRAALASNALMACYAQAVDQLLRQSGCSAQEVQALGAHGQTVRHRPQQFDGCGYTLQLANGAWLAEHTGITTVCDFRSADVAAGGQGAPLVPAFHAACFAEPGRDVALLNVGGIANLSLLPAAGGVRGFDTGPGNVLMNLWSQLSFQRPYDHLGQIAASGRVHPNWLTSLLAEPYFSLPPPKSTGRDLFNPDWLDTHLARWRAAEGPLDSADVMATLAELTVLSVGNALHKQLPGASRVRVCGGGAFNDHLMQRWRQMWPRLDWASTASDGVPPDQMEALAFAWLAACRINARPASLPDVTGARGPRVLGAIYAAPPGAAD